MRTLKNAVILAVAGTVLTVSACSGDDPASGADGSAISLQNCGRTVTLKKPADAAITVNQGATESALAVGAGGQLVGTAYLDSAIAPQWAAAYGEIPVLSEKYPTREAVLEKHPDLIAASYSSAFDDKALGSRQSFDDLGVATYVSPFGCEDKLKRPASSWDAVAGETSDYGVLFGRTADADRVNADMRAKLADLTAKSAGRGKTVLWWDSSTDKPFVGAGDGGPQLVIDAVGAKNVFGDLSGNWAETGWEAVLKADPDVIVLVDADWDPAAAKRKYLESDPALKDLKAVAKGSFVVIPFAESTPGPRLIDGAAKLSDALAK
ncbi:ABC transporter substrate-binding protein [Gordonia sp. PS3]|uniref:ABC transporter substrate-binding protein n=1 Tax=Gordonia TaxID=2053 RepID=UPI00061FAC5D|nr:MULTISPECIES: ABC transporter substrate-binding protein [Gordonia]KJR09142.1 iron ABC transporter substrate-binding protein [Gordonia sihwensis]KXT55808.1 iron ABC transporter substrate-binding protein [Gordonia sp. QH-12]